MNEQTDEWMKWKDENYSSYARVIISLDGKQQLFFHVTFFIPSDMHSTAKYLVITVDIWKIGHNLYHHSKVHFITIYPNYKIISLRT